MTRSRPVCAPLGNQVLACAMGEAALHTSGAAFTAVAATLQLV